MAHRGPIGVRALAAYILFSPSSISIPTTFTAGATVEFTIPDTLDVKNGDRADYNCSAATNSDTCVIHCQAENQALTVDCLSAGLCEFHCEAKKCVDTLTATDSDSLTVTCSADQCFDGATIALPDSGTAVFADGTGKGTYRGATITAGSNTQSITISCTESNDDCKSLDVDAKSAEYLEIVGGDINGATIKCPRGSSQIPSCIIDVSGSTLTGDISVEAQYGAPFEFWIKNDDGLGTLAASTSLTVKCSKQSSSDDVITGDGTSAFYLTPSNLPNCMAPTLAPTVSPTAPTSSPSVSPSTKPSVSPSSTPSRSPTSNPSVSPTDSTLSPSVNPSQSPTANPSTSPSANPSKSPSKSPSPNPTGSPSTHSPSVNPSESPSVKPTEAPTLASAVITDDGVMATFTTPTTVLILIVCISVLLLTCFFMICVYYFYRRFGGNQEDSKQDRKRFLSRSPSSAIDRVTSLSVLTPTGMQLQSAAGAQEAIQLEEADQHDRPTLHSPQKSIVARSNTKSKVVVTAIEPEEDTMNVAGSPSTQTTLTQLESVQQPPDPPKQDDEFEDPENLHIVDRAMCDPEVVSEDGDHNTKTKTGNGVEHGELEHDADSDDEVLAEGAR